MRIVVDHKLRIAQSELPADVLDLIEDALTIPNLERIKQMEQGISGWQRLPESISLLELDHVSRHFTLPRGFKKHLLGGLQALGVEYELEYNTVLERCRSLNAPEILLRPWQKTAVETMLAEHQGIWKAPPGAGKTVGILEAVRRLNASSIILVNTLDILRQWQDRAREFLGADYPVSLIGGGEFEISDYLTIATVQTLHSRFSHLEDTGFFDEFSFVCLDECHHATAETYNKLLGRFSAHYRIGVSATPDKTGEFALASNVLGPIIVETTRAEVDTLVKPKIFRIPTGFVFKYRGRMGKIPSNYPQLLKALTEDENRNALIVATLFLNSGGHNLVCSKRLDHLATIGQLLQRFEYPNSVFSLTGQESSEQRRAVIDYASKHPCVVLSTLADEALDIPRLDGLFLTFPQRNAGLIEQQVGRVARTHPEKKYANVFDFCDNLVGPCEVQWQVRRREVYTKHGYEIDTVTPDQIIEALKEIGWERT
jgi:superfamily II DNA or RNA helicase